MKWIKLIIVLIGCTFLASCSSVIKSSRVTVLQENYCAPNIVYTDDTTEEQRAFEDLGVKQKLSTHDYRLASHLGLVPQLAKFINSTDPIERLEAKQQIIIRVQLFQTEIDALAAELDCNGERYDQLARVLDAKNGTTNTQLTVASIAIGAAVTLSTALITNDNTNKGLNIAGGVVGTGLGFLLLNPKGKKVELKTNRSLLSNIWFEQNDNFAFPPAVWRVMNDKSFSNEGKLSLIQTLKNRWLFFAFDEEISKKEEELYFGKGGFFKSDGIHLMSDMNNELQATVKTIQQDLRSLIYNVSLLK
ncbi:MULTISPECIES: hypothetical protein [Myroides]|uniref:Lipoprotein n=1 Tax=Myroides profundi TaxID=480520 RepID=A0AAJ4W486_MYRPR|nr:MULTISPECIES: hypothetical protein [Myroides]MDM1398781.1 hypothetical protein [Myroides odoratimimus]SEQ88909.1 hypothetical protein SAMN04488089_10724 [Myroides profundi]